MSIFLGVKVFDYRDDFRVPRFPRPIEFTVELKTTLGVLLEAQNPSNVTGIATFSDRTDGNYIFDIRSINQFAVCPRMTVKIINGVFYPKTLFLFVVLRPTILGNGRVLNRLGNPLQNALVFLNFADGQIATVTDVEGNFNFTLIHPESNFDATLAIEYGHYHTSYNLDLSSFNDQIPFRVRLMEV